MDKIKDNFFFRHREFLALPAAWLLWFYSPHIILKLDPQAGLYDGGFIEALILATATLLSGTTLVWIAHRIFMREVYLIFDDCLIKFKHDLTIWQKVIFSLVCFFGYLLCWVLLVIAYL